MSVVFLQSCSGVEEDSGILTVKGTLCKLYAKQQLMSPDCIGGGAGERVDYYARMGAGAVSVLGAWAKRHSRGDGNGSNGRA